MKKQISVPLFIMMSIMEAIKAKAGVNTSDINREQGNILIDAIIPQPKLTTFLNDDNDVVEQALSTKAILKSLVVYRLVDADWKNPSLPIKQAINTDAIINPLTVYGGVRASAHWAEYKAKTARAATAKLPEVKVGDIGVALSRIEVSFDNTEAKLNRAIAAGANFNLSN